MSGRWVDVEQIMVHRDDSRNQFLHRMYVAHYDSDIVGLAWADGPTIAFPVQVVSDDLVYAMECARQLAISGSHVLLGVPLSFCFVVTTLTIRTVGLPTGDACEAVSGVDSAVSVLAGKLKSMSTKDGHVRAASFSYEIWRANSSMPCVAGEFEFLCMPHDRYARLRGKQSGMYPEFLNMNATDNQSVGDFVSIHVPVVRSVGSNSYNLVGGEACRDFYDHQLDHVPGMLIVEACRQAWQRHRGSILCQAQVISAEFFAFVEHDGEASLAVVREDDRDRIDISQSGQVVQRVWIEG